MPTLASAARPAPGAAAAAVHTNAIVRENQQRGDPGWFLRPTTTGISGYATATSVAAGGSLGIAVTTTDPTYTIDVYRIGWYGGAGARLMLAVPGLPGSNRGSWRQGTFGVANCPTCTYDTPTGLLELHWPVTYTLRVPRTWLSGNYVARLSTAQAHASYVPFVVRDSRPSAVLAVMPYNTYSAYNVWGGKSLYSNSYGPPTHGVGDNAPAGLKVTFERPIAGYDVYVKVDYETVGFLEREGYDVSYATSVDLDRDPALLRGHRVFLSIGHDEYWTEAMRNAVEAGRDEGMNVVFLSGNDVYWQARYEPGSDGDDRSVLVCYRDASIDPLAATAPGLATVRWVDPPVSRAQDSLTGTLYTGRILPEPAPWVLAATAPAWLVAGTGMRAGDAIPGMVGVECDTAVETNSHPYRWDASAAPRSLVLVSESPVVTASGQALFCNTVSYEMAGGAKVFNAGTWSWQDFLTGPGANPRVVRMTENLFARFLGVGARPAA
jgi:hypothetical protein